ncbi:MAG: TonB family protein [Pyrinomonadaceae bacterium MAG19_C2-C3]|nr:TonB family protein [Pyrinomonadaceae bacterium MAG19_C2-C3]
MIHIRIISIIFALGIVVCLNLPCQAQTPLRVALLSVNDQRIAPEIEQSFKRSFEAHDMLSRLTLLDAELAHAASRGAGYAGSLNLTLYQGRDIGASIGCDFFFLIKSETSRRSSFATPVYYEAATSVMLVSTRTGKLVMWNRVAAESENASDAGRLMFDKFNRAVWTYRVAVLRRAEDESRARQVFIAEPSVTTSEMPVVIDEDSPSPDTGNDTDKKDASEKLAGDKVKGEGLTKQSVRPPQPYRRPRPAYTESARDAGVEATIDVEVDVLPDGTVGRVEVVRWGGFGLDEAVTDSIKQTYFRPAMRDGAAVLSRVLLRYNFRRPANATSHATTPN